MDDDGFRTERGEVRPRDRTPGALRLVVMHERGTTDHALPASGVVTVGRTDQADVTLDDTRVSRVHCSLRIGDAVSVTDLGSANGTFVRGVRLAQGETFVLRPGDVIDVGSSVLAIHARAEGVAAAWTPSAEPSGPVSGMRSDVVVEDEAMRRLHALVERVARGTISVLLRGETGVGKEIFAERIHRLSQRAAKPFLRLNCAALSESLLESELFGHEKGAFTGAVAAKPGLLESAHGGTVFVDEVGELPMTIQVKLLRVIEERRVTRVGGLHPRDIDVRFVAATHRDLDDLIARERFRQDLYFRLNGISVAIPALRDRVAELPALARLFCAEACARSGLHPVPVLRPAALDALRAHRWPGNLRELRNVMERAALLAPNGAIDVEQLGLETRPSAPGAAPATGPASSVRGEIDALERQRILEALERHAGNQTRAAESLGMPRRTFVQRLTQYGIARPRKP